MSRMTASIKRINEHLEKVSGMDGKSSDIMERVLEPLVEFICGRIYDTSLCCVGQGKWIAEWKEYTGADAGFHYCSKCGQQAFNYEDGGEVVEVLSDFCPSCGRPTTPEGLAELEKRLRG